MSNFENAYKVLLQVEFGNNPSKFLHHNSTEESITLGGIYKQANPNAIDWIFVEKIMRVCESNDISELLSDNSEQYKKDMKRASRMLYVDIEIQDQVKRYFKKHYWDTLRLDEVQSQKIAEEMFLFGVVSGTRNSAKISQKLVGAKVDGYIGDISIKCINNFNSEDFDIKFDELEKLYYDGIVAKNPDLKIYLKGWRR